MVNQVIPERQTKYELLTDTQRPRWKLRAYCLVLVVLAIGVLFAIRAWVAVTTLIALEKYTSPVEQIEDAKVAAWVCRARMYTESTKTNQNAERDAIVYASEPQLRKQEQFDQIIACYYTIPKDLNTSKELGPSHIDPHLCTHIIVGFASVVNCTLALGENSSIYKKVVDLKKREPKLKVMVSAGGMDELRRGFPEMVENHASRKTFIRSVLNVTKSLGLDGLDLDWEFPAWLGANNRQKIQFVQLLEELRRAFDRSGRKLLLTIAGAAPPAIIDQSYNIPQFAELIDFVNVMAYDYHYYIWYFPVTGLNAPLYARSVETGYLSMMNVNYTAYYWLSKGMPRDKIVIGIPTYGHSYTLDNPDNHNLDAPVNGLGKLGELGFVEYAATCRFLESGAQRSFENDSKVPYAYKDYEWVSYDDVTSVSYKAEWIRANGFRGAMLFSLNDDDWNSACVKNTTFPLTRTVFDVFQKARN